MKTICEFYRKGLYFCRFRWLPIEGTFFKGRILTLTVLKILPP